MSKFGRKLTTPPDGFEVVEPTLTALDNELRESKHYIPNYKEFSYIIFSSEL